MELELLRTIWERLGTPSPVLIGLVRELKETNVSLWVIEDKIRECERRQEFGSRFIELARAVYQNNDRRSELKRKINELSGSTIIEEKSYSSY